jgi:two-component system NtrC family response regulator
MHVEGSKMAHILIVDDDETLRYALSQIVRQKGHTPILAGTCREALNQAAQESIDLVFLDVRLPDGNGLDILPQLACAALRPEVIIITGYGDPDGAELAISNGAWDYIEKTDSVHKIALTLERALLYRGKCMPQTDGKPVLRDLIVGSSARLDQCLALMAKSAAVDANVLLTGETGTGKELFARAIHQNSNRTAGPFLTVDCTSLPQTLAEGLLFGHCRGAFTGADQDRQGLILQADGGTLFLDEIGELNLPVQKSFLRVLQERKLRPLGGKREINVDFRLIAASNRDLQNMVDAGAFRQDLFYRIKNFHIHLPPLRERVEDIQPLVAHYVERFCREIGVTPKQCHTELFETLTTYDWPGNVRELIHAIHYAVSVARQMAILFPNHLPPSIRTKTIQAKLGKPAAALEATPMAAGDPASASLPSLKSVRDKELAKIEKQYLNDLMITSDGNIQDACRISGLSQSRLYALLKQYGIAIVKG